MNLTIDIGNTCTKLVAFDGASPVEEVRVDDNEWHKLSSFCQKLFVGFDMFVLFAQSLSAQKTSLFIEQ